MALKSSNSDLRVFPDLLKFQNFRNAEPDYISKSNKAGKAKNEKGKAIQKERYD